MDLEKKWGENTNKAKDLIKNKHGYQMDIGGLCLEVVEISRGGAKYKNEFTMKRFARETGISQKTLSNWVCLYKNVYLKLDPVLRQTTTYTAMNHIHRFISRDATNKEVSNKIERYLSRDNYEAKVMRYIGDLRAVAHNFEKEENLAQCSTKTLEEALFYAKMIVSNIQNKSDRKIRPKDNSIVAKMAIRAVATDASSELATRYYLDEDGFKIKVTEKDLKIFSYLKKSKKPQTPTEIGSKLTSLPKSSTSAWACRSLNKLVSLKKVKRLKGAKYSI